MIKSMSVLSLFFLIACGQATNSSIQDTAISPSDVGIVPGADQLELYLPLLEGRKVGLMGNQTSVVGDEHLVDVLLDRGVDLKFAFAPEHGFRGEIEGGVRVVDEIDEKTDLPVYTLHLENEKADSIVSTVDIVVFDIQDVGARFYTFIWTMHRVMQLCANQGKKMIVLDRPNPNGDQVDGPVRKDDRFKSPESFHKIAMVHGLTVGELAGMINGEGWLDGGVQCDLEVITVKNYNHNMRYKLPVIPSPSLPNHLSVRLYPSLCLFEATIIGEGRGTDWPFQVLGYPNPLFGDFTFVPTDRPGMSRNVKGKGEVNYGVDLRGLDADNYVFTLRYILDFYHKTPDSIEFFINPNSFDKLAGTDELRKQIIAGLTEDEIRASWEDDLSAYKNMRAKYLLYP